MNGAGKTTAMRVLAGRLRADEGRARVLGGDPRRLMGEVARRFGQCIGAPLAYPETDRARESDRARCSSGEVHPLRHRRSGHHAPAGRRPDPVGRDPDGWRIRCPWSYGREFTDGTVGALAGLAVPRRTVGLAKALLLVVWLAGCLATSIVVTGLLSLLAGGRLSAGAGQQAAVAAVAGLLAVALVVPFGWVATATRSQLGTIGVLIGVVMVTQIVVVLGAGTWFPYAVPSLLTGMGGDEVTGDISVGAMLLTAALCPASVVAIAGQWQRLDDT